MEMAAQGSARCSVPPTGGVTAVLAQPNSAHPVLPGAQRGSGGARKPQGQGLPEKQVRETNRKGPF